MEKKETIEKNVFEKTETKRKRVPRKNNKLEEGTIIKIEDKKERKSNSTKTKELKEKVAKLREMSPLWEMHQEGVDLNQVKWSEH